MPDPDLLKLIRLKAEKDRDDLLRAAREEARIIIENAERESERMRREAFARVEMEAESLRERRYNSIRFQMNAKRYALKSAAIKAIWHDVDESLGSYIRSDDYPGILSDLFFEGIESVPDGSIVKAHSSDASNVQSLIRSSGRNLVFQADDTVIGGVEFVWPDKRIVLRNTLADRLSKLRAEGNAEIARLLFGEIATP